MQHKLHQRQMHHHMLCERQMHHSHLQIKVALIVFTNQQIFIRFMVRIFFLTAYYYKQVTVITLPQDGKAPVPLDSN